MDKKFKLGDFVQLKKGLRPIMTVHEYEENPNRPFSGYIICKWFIDGNTTQKDRFHQDSLEKAS